MARATARVLLGEIPPILADLVRDVLEAQPDIHVVGDAKGAALARAAREKGADVVLVSGQSLQLPQAWRAVLELQPPVRLLALTQQGSGAMVCELLDELSLDDLLTAIRR